MTIGKVAVIGGTGFYKLLMTEGHTEIELNTLYGSVYLDRFNIAGKEVYFLARHGKEHSIPPHMINYRANVAALEILSVDVVIATAAVGSLRSEINTGAMVLIDQFIDFTKARKGTFYDGCNGEVVHVDVTEPYCPAVRQIIKAAARQKGYELLDGGCYICTEGPRFETPAEIKMMARWGGDLVGMTNVPEVVLAREAGLCYATIALVTNMAAGVSETPLNHEEVLMAMEQLGKSVADLILCFLRSPVTKEACTCSIHLRNNERG